MNGLKSACYLFVVLLMSACAASPELVVPPDGWEYEANAIILHAKGPADLNAVNGRPHSLSLAVFQLSDPGTFNGLAGTAEGAVELMKMGALDESVVDFSRITIRPGETRTVTIGRAKGAQYIGLISGYFDISPSQDVHLFPVPVVSMDRGSVEILLSALGLISATADARPDRLEIHVQLGRFSTRQAFTPGASR